MLNATIEMMDLQQAGYKANVNAGSSAATEMMSTYLDAAKDCVDSWNLLCGGLNPLLTITSGTLAYQKQNLQWGHRYVHEMTKHIPRMEFGLEHTVLDSDNCWNILKVADHPAYPQAGENGSMVITVPFMRGPALADYANREETSITRQAMRHGFKPYIIHSREGCNENKFCTHADYRDAGHWALQRVKEDGGTPHLVNICASGYKFTIAVAEDMKEKKGRYAANERYIHDLVGDDYRAQDVPHTEIDCLVKSITNVGVPWQVSKDSPIKQAADRIQHHVIGQHLRENDYLSDGRVTAFFWKIFTMDHLLDYLMRSDLKFLQATYDPDYDPTKSDTFRSWLEEDHFPLPGTLQEELVYTVFKAGELPERFGPTLTYMDLPLICKTGELDDISWPKDCRAMADDVGTAPEKVFFLEKQEAGHSGIYISKKSVSAEYPNEWVRRDNGFHKVADGSWQDIFRILKSLPDPDSELIGEKAYK
ncbi:MAG: hypothetical protein ACQESG_02580 [Nanobdellota archaeon]